jgi:hypothetical protein
MKIEAKILKEYRFQSNPQEKVFVDTFLEDNRSFKDMSLIVFGSKPNSDNPKEFLSEREHSIVISTIQWLGSPVGQNFLQSCGFQPDESVRERNSSKEI